MLLSVSVLLLVVLVCALAVVILIALVLFVARMFGSFSFFLMLELLLIALSHLFDVLVIT